jgi:hypothetical protein
MVLKKKPPRGVGKGLLRLLKHLLRGGNITHGKETKRVKTIYF